MNERRPDGQSDPSERRALHNQGREVADVQADEGRQRRSQSRRRRRTAIGQDQRAARSEGSGSSSQVRPGSLHAGHSGGEQLRQQHKPGQRTGREQAGLDGQGNRGLAPDSGKFPINVSSGPTVRVHGTELEIDQ